MLIHTAKVVLMYVAATVEYLAVSLACFLLPWWMDEIVGWYGSHTDRVVEEVEADIRRIA